MWTNVETKTERNGRVQKLYDQLMMEGKHGHYETMFRIVRIEVEAEREACARRPLDRRVSRPTVIEFAWIDPWTGEFCAGAHMPYTRERMASGFYRRQIVAMKPLAKTWTGPRTPKLKMGVHRAG